MDTLSAAVRSETSPQGLAPQAPRYLKHPFLVFRVASSRLTDMEPLRQATTLVAARSLHAHRAGTDRMVTALCADLATRIAQTHWTDAERNGLIQIKRDLHNRRTGRIAKYLSSIGAGAMDIRERVAQAVTDIDALAQEDAEFATTYDSSLAESRKTLRALSLGNTALLKGISFSAPELLQHLYDAQATPEKFGGKRGRDLDRALYNFFARASVKVSPLTWFTPVLVARWTEGGAGGTVDLGDRPILSRVELSRRVTTKIAAAIFRNPATWSPDTVFALNPTAVLAGEFCRFSDPWAEGGAGPRTWGVNPPLLQLKASPPLLCLCRLMEGNLSGLEAAVLCEGLAQGFGGDANRAWAFIAQALKAGLLVPQTRTTEQEAPEPGLRARFAHRRAECLVAMDTLDAAVDAFRDGAPPARLKARRLISETCQHLSELTGAARDTGPSPSFYEDCFLGGAMPEVAPSVVADATAAFQTLSSLFPLLDYNHVIQSVVAALFRQAHGTAMPASSLVDIAEQAQAMAQRLTPLPLLAQADELEDLCPNAAALLRGKFALLKGLYDEVAGGRDARLSEDAITRYAALIPAQIRRRPSSYTIIGQPCRDADGNGFALNRIYSGHSMLMSRFMRDLPQDEVGEIGRYLRSYGGPDARLAEIPGVFGFNANLHPQFVDSEIAIPGRRSNYATTEKIALGDLSVAYDPDLDRLALSDADGHGVLLHYFGFLNLMVLPPLYQLLGRSSTQGLILDIWQELLFAGFIPRDQDLTLGRLQYRDVTLSRRSAYIAPDSLPDPAGAESDFYLKLPALLGAFPDACADFFARLVADREDFMPSAGQPQGAALDTTDFKPSYFSLEVPASVSALQRQLTRRLRGVLVQEARPDLQSAGVTWRGHPHACEIQFEIGRVPGGL